MIMISNFLFNFTNFSVIIIFLTKSLVSVVLVASSSYTMFVTTSFFTASLRLLKSTRVVSNLSISNVSISDFNLAKSTFSENFDVSTPTAFLKSVLLHN